MTTPVNNCTVVLGTLLAIMASSLGYLSYRWYILNPDGGEALYQANAGLPSKANDNEVSLRQKEAISLGNDVKEEAFNNRDAETLQRERHALVQRVCQRSEPSVVLKTMEDYQRGVFPADRRTARGDGPSFNAMIVNERDKFLLCQINKAGMRTSLHFFHEHNGHQVKQYGSYESYQTDSKSQKMTEYFRVKLVPLRAILDGYRNFTKMLVVRHPLQRYVSSYYQTLLLGNHMARGLDSFSKFIEARVLNKTWYNFHWSDFQEACHPCMVDFDYIFRTENIDDEFPDLSEAIGFGVNTQYGHMHNNPNFSVQASSPYKYDDMLADVERKEPELFQRLLERCAVDMDMFGYTWENHRSGCSIGSGRYC